MAERVSLKAVAAVAGVSISTASTALSGRGPVSAATRSRVEACAKELGYVPDLTLASLASGRFRHSGKPVIIAAWMRGAQRNLIQRAAGLGMAVRVINVSADQVAERINDLGAAAVVAYQRTISMASMAALPVPSIFWVDEDPSELLVDVVETCDWWAATCSGVTQVRAAGYTSPVMVLIPARPRHWHDDVRLAAGHQMGIPVLEWDLKLSSLRSFLAQNRPDAVIGGVSQVFFALKELGPPPPFASLIVPPDRLCDGHAGWLVDDEHRELVTLEMIEQRLRYGPRPPRRIVVPPRWKVGRSLPLRR